MSVADNKLLLDEYIAEVWDASDIGAIRSFLSPSFRRYVSPLLPPLGIEDQIERITGFREAFPDVRLTVQEVTAEDDRVAFRSTVRGTHLGKFAGIPPTGNQVVVGLLDVVRIEDGRFVEQWGGPDLFDLLRQLGATVTATR
jgi:predicted ester cyclase